MIEILVVCPAHAVTGGPEALHAFTCELNKQRGVKAKIWYWGDPTNPSPPEYALYACEYVTALPEGFAGAIIVPEIWANEAMAFDGCIKAVYWLGLDAYAKWTSEPG